jgi:DNA-binding SARP family transcriptional activator
VLLPLSAQRLLAFLALQDHPVLRVYVAGMLWIDLPEDRAFANLRSTLWRLNQSGRKLGEATGRQLRLAPGIYVDLHDAATVAHGLLDGSVGMDDPALGRVHLDVELLPDWYDDWVLIERERHRQLMLHALEALADRLTASRRYARAAEVALAAVAGEPLRESAHRAVIRAHLAEGNPSEAIRQYRFFAKLLRDQLDLEPSPQMEELVRGLTT